jgi:hypothetical protein
VEFLNTPTSRSHPDISAEMYLNTAASRINPHQQQQHPAQSSSWAGIAAAASPQSEEVDIAVELRLADAEERLRQHSTLLSLFLDITSADQQLQRLELREEEEKEEKKKLFDVVSRRDQQQRSIAEVLERAERTRKTSPKVSPRPRSNFISTINKEGDSLVTMPSVSPPQSAAAAKNNKNKITEERLLERLAHFDEETATLKAKMSMIRGNPYVMSSFTLENEENSSTKSNFGGEIRAAEEQKKNSTSPKKSKSVSFIPARHTLKSAAAAVATRRSLESDINENSCVSVGGDGGGGGNEATSATKDLYKLHKAAALLKPREGSTTALISEVAALRKRVANSLACIEQSTSATKNPTSGDAGNFDFIIMTTSGVGRYDLSLYPSLDI